MDLHLYQRAVWCNIYKQTLERNHMFVKCVDHLLVRMKLWWHICIHTLWMNNYHTIWSQERLYDSGQEPLFIFLWEKADLFLLLLATTKKCIRIVELKKLHIIFLYFSFVICIYGYHLPFRHNEPVPSAIYIAVAYKTSSPSLSLSLSKSESSLEGE